MSEILQFIRNHRLVAISNRTAAGAESRAGGLAVALWETLEETEGLWIGWSGSLVSFAEDKLRLTEEDGVNFALLD